MADLLGLLTSFFSWVYASITAVIDVIVSQPALLIMVIGFSVVGFVVGIISRLFRT